MVTVGVDAGIVQTVVPAAFGKQATHPSVAVWHFEESVQGSPQAGPEVGLPGTVVAVGFEPPGAVVAVGLFPAPGVPLPGVPVPPVPGVPLVADNRLCTM